MGVIDYREDRWGARGRRQPEYKWLIPLQWVCVPYSWSSQTCGCCSFMRTWGQSWFYVLHIAIILLCHNSLNQWFCSHFKVKVWFGFFFFKMFDFLSHFLKLMRPGRHKNVSYRSLFSFKMSLKLKFLPWKFAWKIKKLKISDGVQMNSPISGSLDLPISGWMKQDFKGISWILLIGGCVSDFALSLCLLSRFQRSMWAASLATSLPKRSC